MRGVTLSRIRHGVCNLAVALVLLSSGWAQAQSTAQSTAQSPAPYQLHAVLPLTGGAAFLGKSVQAAMEAVKQVINKQGGIHGRPVEFVYHDDQTSPQTAVQVTNDVLATHPVALFGSAIAAMCNAMAPLMKNGPVMYCLSPAIHPAAGSFVFTASVSQNDYFLALLKYAHHRGWKRIALLTTTDASGQDADRGVAAALALPENKDITLVAHEHFNPSDVAITAQIERIRDAKPDMLFGWAAGATMGTLFRGLAQNGYDVPTAASTSSMTWGQIQAFSAFLPKELYYAGTIWPAYGDARVVISPAVKQQLAAYYKAAQAAGWKPDAASETGWDPVLVVVSALNRLPANADAEALRKAIATTTDHVGIDGIYDYGRTPQRGLGPRNTLVTRWDAAAHRWVPVTGPEGSALK